MVSAEVLHRGTWAFLIVGLGFSLFAMFESLDTALQSVCSLNPFFSCARVDASAYSHIGPVPDWSIGVGGFIVMIVVEAMLQRTYDHRLLQLLLGLSLTAVGVTVVLAYTELFLITPPVFCPVCLGSYLSNLGVLGCVLGLVRLRRGALREEAADSSGPSHHEEEEEEDTPPSPKEGGARRGARASEPEDLAASGGTS